MKKFEPRPNIFPAIGTIFKIDQKDDCMFYMQCIAFPHSIEVLSVVYKVNDRMRVDDMASNILQC